MTVHDTAREHHFAIPSTSGRSGSVRIRSMGTSYGTTLVEAKPHYTVIGTLRRVRAACSCGWTSHHCTNAGLAGSLWDAHVTDTH